MGKKKFIDKKKSATFQLFARDSSDPLRSPSTSDRVFVRVDNNPYSSHGFINEDDGDADDCDRFDDSIFADAPEDQDYDKVRNQIQTLGRPPLPDSVRREILELGLPDDGYNYLLHLREIKNVGGGSAYYHNSKAKLDQVPLDVKVYDASAVRIKTVVKDDTNDSVLSKTVGVRVQKAVDPDVAALLDDSDLSRFGSDVDDLEEDFVVQANILDGGEQELIGDEKKVAVDVRSEVIERVETESADSLLVHVDELKSQHHEDDNDSVDEKPRIRRPLDEQFDLLALREYGTDSDNDDADSIGTEGEPLANKLNHALNEYNINDLDLDDKYRAPGDFVHGNQGSDQGKQQDSSADVLRRCAEYAEMYSYENHDVEDLVVLQESSDESELWDFETIVSTYSNLDNHPGKIQAPEKSRKKLPVTIPGASTDNSHVISLRGKEMLPVEFLPHGRRTVVEKAKKATTMGTDLQKRRAVGESKEEKKERKAAVKEERREARRAKKELKELYRCEAQRAQKVVAIAGPCSIHLIFDNLDGETIMRFVLYEKKTLGAFLSTSSLDSCH